MLVLQVDDRRLECPARPSTDRTVDVRPQRAVRPYVLAQGGVGVGQAARETDGCFRPSPFHASTRKMSRLESVLGQAHRGKEPIFGNSGSRRSCCHGPRHSDEPEPSR
jgi:hypothetical protein